MYEITISPNSLAIWFTQVYAGLYEMQRNGKARLILSTSVKSPDLYDSFVLAIEVKELNTGRKLKILIDMSDYRKFAVVQAHDLYDIIIKRSFSRDEINNLPDHNRKKILPYGINYECNSPAVPILHLFIYHHMMRARLLRRPKSKWHKFNWHHQLRFLSHLIHNNKTLNEIDFEGSPYTPTKHRIFFITRLFDYSVKEGLTSFMRGRIELVKALKKEFGDRFYGGIVKDHLSERYCPKDILYAKASHRVYINTLKQSDISICTLGSGQSTPWKLGEAIAGARCIVSEPLVFELPTPLQEGVHLKTFVTVDDCLHACDELLRKPDLIKQLKENTWSYYQQNVKAEKLIENLLSSLFTCSTHMNSQ